MNSTRLVVAFATVVAICSIPSVATAAVTSTNITSPANGAIVVWDDRTGTGSSSIVGAAPGASNGDLVDILCYTPRGFINEVATDVAVSGGSFSHTDLSWVSGSICRLRAVPANTEPIDVSPFTGPVAEINQINVQLANPVDDQNLKPNDFDVRAGQFDGQMEWSAGSCPLNSTLVDMVAFTQTRDVFDCAHRFNGLNDLEQDVDPPDSPIQIDGEDGWLTSNLAGFAFENDASFPELTMTPSINLTSGNLQLETTEGIVTCTGADPDWWAPDQDCPPLVNTGVRLERTVTQSHAGTKAVVRDRWVSTDGQPHTVSLHYREGFRFTLDGSPNARFIFPGPTTFDPPTDGQVVPGPIAEGAMIYAFDPAFADGSTQVGRAGIKLVSGADAASFEADIWDAPTLVLSYVNRTIPADGALELTTEFYQAFSDQRIDELAAGAPDPADDVDDTPAPGGGGTTAMPTIAGPLAVRTTASRGKRPRVTVSTNRAVTCPAGGAACSATVALTTKVKVRSGRKVRTKSVKLGNFKFTIPAGSSQKLRFVLAAKHTKLFKANRSLKLSALISASAGSGSAVLATDSYTAKHPRFKR